LSSQAADKTGPREALLEFRILRNDSLWVADAWRMQLAAGQPSASQPQSHLADVLRYVATPGRYHVELTAKDLGSKATQQKAELDIQIAPVQQTELWMSDVELAATIRKEESDSAGRAFHKNQLLVIPQPDRTYSAQRPMLFYYVEIYNLLENAPGDNYQVKTYVSDTQGKMISEVRGRTIRKSKSMNYSVEVGSLHLGKLAAGDYVMNIEVLSADDQRLGNTAKPFAMLAVPAVPAAASLPAEFLARFAAMTEKQVEKEFKQAAYIMSSEEQQMYGQLTNLEAKKQFLAEYWWRRDPSPATPENEFYGEYLRRIDYANKNLRSFAREGWQTDRGRVYILYGVPSDIEFFPSSENTRPYERWRYDNLEGGVEFIFIDRTGFKEYRLVHSTKVGEIKDPDWTRLLSN
jgi:GWxTD domain-containing protein